MTNTTQPDAANAAALIAAIEAGLTEGLSFYGAMTGYSSPEITAARAAFRALVTDYERLRAFVEGVTVKARYCQDEFEAAEYPIEELDTFRLAYNALVTFGTEGLALLASLPAGGESEGAE